MEKIENIASIKSSIKKEDKVNPEGREGTLGQINLVKKTGFFRFVNWFIEFPLYLVIILLPIFFYQNVPSPLELNKQLLLVALVGLSALAWIGQMAWKNEIRFKKSFLLIPILTFLLIYALSTVFSGYYEQSMWGYFGGEAESFVSFLFFSAFFILIYNNVKNYQDVSKLIFSFLLGGFILIIFSIFQFFEVYLMPFDFSQTKFFNPIGSIYIYSVYLTLIFLVSISLFLSSISKWIKVFLIVISLGSFFMLMIINFKIIWLILLLMLSFILGMTVLIENKKPSQLRILPMIFLILALLFLLRGKPLLNNSELPVEVSLKHNTALEISLSSIKSNPLLGSGPATFSNVYRQNRPDNLGEFSAINFNNSSSFFLTLASTTGILGIISFLFLVFSGLGFLFREIIKIVKAEPKNNLNSYLGVAIGVGWLFLTIILFLYSINITLLMLWWLFFALLISMSFLSNKNKEGVVSEIATTSDNPKISFFLSFGFVLVIIGFIAIIYLQGQRYLAAVYFNQAMTLSSQDESTEKIADKISKAVLLDPNRDSYYRDLSVLHLALAKEKIVEKGLQNLTPEESNYVSARFRSALQSLNQAKTLNPADSSNFVAVANLYSEFITIQKDSGEKAIENYQRAIELDPKNPEIYQAMANVQIMLADLEILDKNSNKKAGEEIETPQKSLEYLAMAEDYLKKALLIKADYIGANVLLVSVYEKEKETEKALNKALENVEIFPTSAELYLDLSRLYYQQEDYTQAEINLQTALSLNPQYSNARYLFGLTLEKQGKSKEALTEFEKIAESNPDNELLIKIISNLKNGREALSGVSSEVSQEELEPEMVVDELVDDKKQEEGLPEAVTEEIIQE